MMPPVPIEPDEVGRFSIDSENNLYWDGQRVQTESRLKLSSLQSKVAMGAAIATMLACLGTMANAAASWTTYFTKQHESSLQQQKQAKDPVPANASPTPSGDPAK